MIMMMIPVAGTMIVGMIGGGEQEGLYDYWADADGLFVPLALVRPAETYLLGG